MSVIQGIVDESGMIVRSQGVFTVLSKSATQLVIKVPGEDLTKAFVLCTPWRLGWDIAPVGIAASPTPPHWPPPSSVENMLFAVDGYYGVSFRIET